MKKEKIVRYSSNELRNLEKDGGDKTDWVRVNSMKDEDIVGSSLFHMDKNSFHML